MTDRRSTKPSPTRQPRRCGTVVAAGFGVLAMLATLALAIWPAAIRAADKPAAKPACPAPVGPLTADQLDIGLRKAKDHGFLWRISRDGRSSYLYGTIHAARVEWKFPGPSVMEALRASDTLALELDVLDPDIQQRLATSIRPQRAEALPKGLADRLERRRAAECIDASGWSDFAPEFQVASLTVMAARRDGLDPAHAIDLVLDVVARQLGKPVASLESPEAQMSALQMPTEAERIAFVKSGLDDLDSGRARPLLNRVAKVWRDGNYAELARYERWCGCVRTPGDRAAMKRLLFDRNPVLADGIERLHAGGRQVFAAVGSLHTVGPNGLPALLRQRGFKVEQGEIAR